MTTKIANTKTNTMGIVVYSTTIKALAVNKRVTKLMLPEVNDLNSDGNNA